MNSLWKTVLDKTVFIAKKMSILFLIFIIFFVDFGLWCQNSDCNCLDKTTNKCDWHFLENLSRKIQLPTQSTIWHAEWQRMTREKTPTSYPFCRKRKMKLSIARPRQWKPKKVIPQLLCLCNWGIGQPMKFEENYFASVVCFLLIDWKAFRPIFT